MQLFHRHIVSQDIIDGQLLHFRRRYVRLQRYSGRRDYMLQISELRRNFRIPDVICSMVVPVCCITAFTELGQRWTPICRWFDQLLKKLLKY